MNKTISYLLRQRKNKIFNHNTESRTNILTQGHTKDEHTDTHTHTHIDSQNGRVNLVKPHSHMLEWTWTHTLSDTRLRIGMGEKPISFQRIAFSAASIALSVGLYARLTMCLFSRVCVYEIVN